MSRVAATWLNDLATLVAGATPISDLKAKVAGMSAMLGDDYPPEAFSRASLNHVARQVRFFPSYGELTEHLSAWWQAHRPPSRALPAPSGEVDREEETRQFWLTMTDQELRARVAKVDGWTGPGTATAQLVFRRKTVEGLNRYAPQRLGMLPPHWLQLPDENARGSTFGLLPAVPPIRSLSDQADAVTPPKAPGAVSPEVLATLRAQLAKRKAAA